jgi:hypothetical protein
LQEFLGLTSIFIEKKRMEFGELPNFWNADTYEALLVK